MRCLGGQPELTLLLWRIGQRIPTEVLAGQRAGYGEVIMPTLAEQLARDYGRDAGVNFPPVTVGLFTF